MNKSLLTLCFALLGVSPFVLIGVLLIYLLQEQVGLVLGVFLIILYVVLWFCALLGKGA